MNSVVAIAFNTFKEAVRNRILYIILFFALIMIGTSGIIGQLTTAAQSKIIKDLGFSAINLFGVAVAVFVGVSLVYNELERKTIYTIVSKPIDRWQFLIGKFFGLLLTVYVNLSIMTLFFLFTLHYFTDPAENWFVVMGHSAGRAVVNLFAWGHYPQTAEIMPVIMVTFLELAIVVAFAILYSSFSTPVLSMFLTALTFIAGRMNEDIILFAENLHRQAVKAGTADPLSYHLAHLAALVTPNLGVFHRTVEQAVHTGKVDIWWESIVYAVVYTAGVVTLSAMIFSRRNFK